MDSKKEEYFVKCRAILEEMEKSDCDIGTLLWIAEDYLELLGRAIGIVRNKQE